MTPTKESMEERVTVKLEDLVRQEQLPVWSGRLTNWIIESLFREIYEGKKTLTNGILSLIKEVVIHIKKSVDKIQNNNHLL